MSSTYYEEQTTTTTTTTTSSSEKGCCGQILDYAYLKGIPGLLKLVEVAASLVAYICAEVAVGDTDPASSGGFFKFMTLFTALFMFFIWLMLLCQLQRRILRCDCVNWPFLELMMYLFLLVFLFFADLFISLHGSATAYKAAAVFGWLAFIALVVDGVWAFRNYWKSRSNPMPPAGPTESTADLEQGRY